MSPFGAAGAENSVVIPAKKQVASTARVTKRAACMRATITIERRGSNVSRTVFTINRGLFCDGYATARLLPQSLLVFIYRLCCSEFDSVRVYELVSDDEFPTLAGSKGR